MKKAISLILAVMLILALVAGCTSGGTTTTTPAPDSGSSSGGSTGSTGSTGSSDSTGEDKPAGTVTEDGFVHNYTPLEWPEYPMSDVGQDVLQFDMIATTKDLPLTDEKVTFTAWWPMGANDYRSGYNEAANMQELEARTNIHIEYQHPSTTEMVTAFPLMIASDDYTDMIFYAGLYTGGGDKAIDDGVYLRLNELIEEYAPNYTAIRNYTDEAKKMTISSAGNMAFFYNICKENMPGYMGLNIRKDFMERAGITERPVTIADWDETLGIMLDAIDEAEYAFGLPPTGVTRWSAFLSAWDIGSDWFQRDGVAMYGPNEAEFRNYVELMKSWYDKGYLRTDFYAVPPDNYNNDITWTDYGMGKLVACDGSNTFGSMVANNSGGASPDGYGLAVRQPVLNEGDEIHIRFDQGVVNKGVSSSEMLALTTSCTNPELLTSWVDYRYTFDGYLLLYYGVEGLTYYRTGDYHINITDHIVNNPDGVSPFSYLGKYTAGILQCSVSDYTNGWCFLDPAYAEEIKVWGLDKCDHNFPDIPLLSAADSGEFSSLYADIETYVAETVPKFIIGDLSMDDFDDFQAMLKTMGIDRCIELKQDALDDYNSRG